MLFAAGWAIVRSSRESYRELQSAYGPRSDHYANAVDALDDATRERDRQLCDALEAFLAGSGRPALDWHFRRDLNYHSGVLTFASATNHRTISPWAIEVLTWLAEHGPGSYGLVYLHDDEDVGDDGRARGRDGTDHSNVFRVWRLMNGKVEEFDDPFLSPIVPRLDPPYV